jgi:hypothetical protein
MIIDDNKLVLQFIKQTFSKKPGRFLELCHIETEFQQHDKHSFKSMIEIVINNIILEYTAQEYFSRILFTPSQHDQTLSKDFMKLHRFFHQIIALMINGVTEEELDDIINNKGAFKKHKVSFDDYWCACRNIVLHDSVAYNDFTLHRLKFLAHRNARFQWVYDYMLSMKVLIGKQHAPGVQSTLLKIRDKNSKMSKETLKEAGKMLRDLKPVPIEKKVTKKLK